MKTITKGIGPSDKGIAVGAHFADDGNTWVGQGYGAEVIAYEDGRIEINAGCEHEEYGHICNEEESAAIRKLLFPDAAAFVGFVLRHTWHERAKAHGSKTVYDIIVNHPFAKLFMPKEWVGTVEPISGEALLREAASKFRFYQSQHEEKYRALEKQRDGSEAILRDGIYRRMRDTHEKARVNADIASRIEAFLGGK